MTVWSVRLRDYAPGIAFLIAIFAFVEFASRMKWVNPFIIPAPSAVAAVFGHILITGTFVAPVLQTLGLFLTGYAIGCGLAIVLGVLMGSFPAVYRLFEPITELLRPIPKPALLPALMLFLGLGATMKITVVALAAFFPVLINAVQGTRAIDPIVVDMARTFGYSKTEILYHIVLRATAPFYLAGMRVALGIALAVVVIAEMLAGSGGVGIALVDMQRQFQVRETYAWLLILAILGLVLNGLFTWLERRATFWNVPGNS